MASGITLADDNGDKVTVRIFTPCIVVKEKDNVKEVAKALEKLPSVKIVPHSDATPHFLIEFNRNKVDLGDLAKAIAAVETGAAKDETAAFLYLNVEIKKEQQDKLLKALANVKGVDTKKSEFHALDVRESPWITRAGQSCRKWRKPSHRLSQRSKRAETFTPVVRSRP